METLAIFFSLFSFISFFNISTAGDTLILNQSINNTQTLVSKGGVFELGFFSRPINSSNRYLGIWYKKLLPQQVVWVANMESPISTSNGFLTLNRGGNLAISSHENKTIIWSTHTSKATNPIVQLLDTGNLVLNDSNKLLWQSFDHPSNTLLPGMKLGRDSNTQWSLTSWKNDDSDPSLGAYTYSVSTQGPPEGYMINRSSKSLVWRSGPWDGHGWNGFPMMTSNDYFVYSLYTNHVGNQVYYSYELANQSIVSVVVLQDNGVIQRLVWDANTWNKYWNLVPDVCETYGFCGQYGVCINSGSSVGSCTCLNGFEPRSTSRWTLRNWSGGCERRTSLDCAKGDGFKQVTGLKLPNTVNASWNSTKSLDECRDWCLKNCSCLAYAMISTEGGGCINWFGGLLDIRNFTDEGGDDLYLRLASSELGLEEVSHYSKKKKKKLRMEIIVAIFSAVCFISIALGILWAKQRRGERSSKRPQSSSDNTMSIIADKLGRFQLQHDVTKDLELPSLDFYIIATSTNNFSDETKLGEGGFGPVHKGTLCSGQEIAVKRLSKGSVQGVEEFKNEIKLIANLQHKNLVRLLGCCIKDDERLLVYEYLPNKSLDKFLFDPKRAVSLNWEARLRVIHGVAQGLLYLHKYSRLRIIHRDLKCSNILLDSEMNPKISDFGIARIFAGNQDEANTCRVVGTYGYMPPEYAIEGLFSEKSDVFSFGVLLLEVVSGRKNGVLNHVGALLGSAWVLWQEERVSELMDPVLCHSCPIQEFMKCVHVGLLCVQEDATKRPTMSSVVSFLGSEVSALPAPNTVAFITWRDMNSDSHSEGEDSYLAGEDYDFSDEVTILDSVSDAY